MNVAYLKVTHGLRFHLFFFLSFFLFLAPDCSFVFTGIVVHHSAANMRCERSRARAGEWCVTSFIFLYFFESNWDGAPLGVGALRKRCTLRIGSGGTETTFQLWWVSLSSPDGYIRWVVILSWNVCDSYRETFQSPLIFLNMIHADRGMSSQRKLSVSAAQPIF